MSVVQDANEAEIRVSWSAGDKPGPVQVELFDLQGRRLDIWKFDTRTMTEKSRAFSVAGMAAGVYLVRVTSSGESISKRVLLRGW
jgi:hypothetical protein